MGDIRKTPWTRFCRWLWRWETPIEQAFIVVGGAYVVLILLSGCAAAPFWHTDIPGYCAPIFKARVATAQELSAICRMERTEEAACAIRLPQACYVYLGPRADACAESHEVRGHCTGKNHSITYGLEQDCAYDI